MTKKKDNVQPKPAETPAAPPPAAAPATPPAADTPAAPTPEQQPVAAVPAPTATPHASALVPTPTPSEATAPTSTGSLLKKLNPTQTIGGITFVAAQILIWVVFGKYFVKAEFSVENTWQMLVLMTLGLLTLVCMLLPLVKHLPREQVSIGLMISSVLFVWIPVWLVSSQTEFSEVWPIAAWAVLNTLGLLSAGLWLRLGDPAVLSKEFDINSLVVMLVCGWIGFTTASLGLLIPFGVQNYSEVLTGGFQSAQDNWPKVAIFFATLFGGLILMLAGLQFGRSLERSSAGVRRLLYGTNAVLMGMVLFSILAIINMVTFIKNPYINMGGEVDWSKSQLHTLNPATERYLKAIDKPVKVYILLDSRDPLREDCERMLQTCRSFNTSISFEAFSPYNKSGEVDLLMKKYQISEPEGLLVVYGPETTEVSHFIPVNELYAEERAPQSDDPNKPRETKRFFKGEGALLSALKFLSDDKRRPVVYFVQINGLPSLMPSMTRQPNQGTSFAELRARLVRQNYEIKPLNFTEKGAEEQTALKVPDDAEIVVVAGLRSAMPKNAVEALSAYMLPTDPTKKKGKMIVLLDVVTVRENIIVTELEAVLEKFSVSCPRERLLNANPNAPSPTAINVWPAYAVENKQIYTHPIAAAFITQSGAITFAFDDVRPVTEIQREGQPRMSPYAVFPLVTTPPTREPVWITSKGSNPDTLWAEIQKNPQAPERRTRTSGVVVGVTVSETPIRMPGHPPVGGQQEVPRLVVFGSSHWVDDEAMRQATGKTNADLFTSSLSWLRGKADLGKQPEFEPKPQDDFTLASTDQGTITRLRWLPVSLILLGLAGLGGGIWAVRRR